MVSVEKRQTHIDTRIRARTACTHEIRLTNEGVLSNAVANCHFSVFVSGTEAIPRHTSYTHIFRAHKHNSSARTEIKKNLIFCVLSRIISTIFSRKLRRQRRGRTIATNFGNISVNRLCRTERKTTHHWRPNQPPMAMIIIIIIMRP